MFEPAWQCNGMANAELWTNVKAYYFHKNSELVHIDEID